MTELPQQPEAALQQKTNDEDDSTSHRTQASPNLRVLTKDSTSDNETNERDARERLKKTSLASLPGNNTNAATLSNATIEPTPEENSKPSSEQREPSEQTPSPSSEQRGRLSRKRSYDDSMEPGGTAVGAATESHHTGDDAKHTRKRSRDVRTIQTQGLKSSAAPIERPLPEDESSDDEIQEQERLDQEMEDSMRSPRKKRSRDDVEIDAQRGQKIAATEEAKAYRRSEDSDRNQIPQYNDKGIADSGSTKKEQLTNGEEAPAAPENDESQSETAPISQFANKNLSVTKSPPGQQKDSSTVPNSFASSGFAAMANSSTSPFGALGAPTSSVFGAKSNSSNKTANTTQPLNNGIFGSQNPPPPTFTADSASPSPFLTSTGATAGSPFAINSAAPNPSGFGGFGFGSGFAKPTPGGPRLTSFAAPKSDVALPKPAEAPKAFGARADASADEAGGSDADADPEEVGITEERIDSRFQQQE
ncbi:MAG: hypothetical protein Q9222_007155, partial [Ikaeria aurantiellina]